MDPMNFNGDKLSGDQQEQLLFMMLVQQHQQIAMMGMGKIKNPNTDEVERELKSAKFAIDTQTLNNLRLNYAEEKKKGDEPEEPNKKEEE